MTHHEYDRDGMFQGNRTVMRTWTERQVDPMNVTVLDIDIADIAHALARQCRFNGHCGGYISVANHSVRVSRLLRGEPRLERWGLLHDASECYLGDIIRPMKYSGKFDTYFEAEAIAEAAIAEKFGLEMPMPQAVKDADTAAAIRELNQLWNYTTTPEADEIAFLDRFKELFL